MGSVASISVTGMDELQRKLQSLGADLGKELSKAGLKAMKLNVESKAKELSRDHNDDGTLTASINTQEVIESGAAIIKTGTNVDYAIYVEYGTGLYATGPGGSRAKKIPWLWKVDSRKWAANFGIERGESVLWWGSHPYPFLRPAFDIGKGKVMDDIKADLQSAIQRYTV